MIKYLKYLKWKKAIKNSTLFDIKYYLFTYPDIRKKGIDPIKHYIKYGANEGRNPSKEFDTSFYINQYPDIQEININPLVHYILHGQNENRFKNQDEFYQGRPFKNQDEFPYLHPAGYKKTILDNSKAPIEISKTWSSKLPDINNSDKLTKVLKDIYKKQIVVSLSHDRYIDHIGGVQICISDEQQALNKEGYCYINISPSCPLPVLAKDKNWHGDIIIDHKYIGTFTAENILTVFKSTLDEKELFLVIHALHGHSVMFINSLYDTISFKKNFFWIHDYFSMCENYNLLRNNLTYCAAPSINSQACQICVYGGEHRKNHLEKINNIFEYIPFTVLAPSQTALDIWLNSSSLPHQDSYVHTHREIKIDEEEESIQIDKDESLKVAFLGHSALHKGWFVFKELVERFQNDQRYEFYHLGMKDNNETCKAKFYEVRNNWNNMTHMQDMIQEKNIHVAFLWSIWPETYNIVAYEALAAGASIITNKNSGNIAKEIKNTKQGIVLDSEEALFEMFENGDIRKKADLIFENHILYGSLHSSNITTTFIHEKENT